MLEPSQRKAIRAILFDKDGTLVDFQKTWGPAVDFVMRQLARGSGAVYARLASAVGFDEPELRFRPDSIFIAQPIGVWGPLWARVLGLEPSPEFLAEVDRQLRDATSEHVAAIGDPAALLAALAGRGYRLGVFSNDSEATVRAHLRRLGIERLAQFVAGFDSGCGAKPDPAPVLAFADAVAVPPQQVAVVGDTALDLAAARAAGAVAIGVLTGPAAAEVRAPPADVVLAGADDLATWLEQSWLSENSGPSA